MTMHKHYAKSNPNLQDNIILIFVPKALFRHSYSISVSYCALLSIACAFCFLIKPTIILYLLSEGEKGRGMLMYGEQKGLFFIAPCFKLYPHAHDHSGVAVCRCGGGVRVEGGALGEGVQVSSAVNRPHQRVPQIKSSYYSWLSHLRDPANITRLTQLFAISKCAIHYKRFLTLI